MADVSARASLLRFITCGSVDDGKSTLIGRLLYDSRALLTDQLDALEQASRRPGRDKPTLDFASLVDGLEDEQAQGITIDVAYRYFATPRRAFIIADTPGHEHYTRNMVTGASGADAAVILIDATEGLTVQTRRHAMLVHLLGIRHVVLAVNKMDLVGWREAAFADVVGAFGAFADAAEIGSVTAIPMAALHGDNVVARSAAAPWYSGPTLIEQLEAVTVTTREADEPVRMAVQLATGDRCAGTLASGTLRPGAALTVAPGSGIVTVTRIIAPDADRDEAIAGEAVMLALDRPVARGDLLCAPDAAPPTAQTLDAMLVWLADAAAGRDYLLKIGTRTVAARIDAVDELVDVASGRRVPGRSLTTNAIGRCRLTLDAPVAALPYTDSRALGGFILIDPETQATVAAGMVC